MQTSINQLDGQCVATLNIFLRGEIAAIKTYVQAINLLKSDPSGVLRKNRDCHSLRAAIIREQIIAVGGTPEQTVEMWSRFTKLVDSGAVVGKQAIHLALEEGEDVGHRLYRDREGTDPAITEFVRAHLILPQQCTHDRMRALKCMN